MAARQGVDHSSKPAVLPRGVRRALDAMRSDPGRDLDLAQLAAIAGMPARTLQRQFRSFLGKAPLAALSDIRFDCARRELLRGSPDAKVMEIALRSGLTHLGRFSAEYRRRYGENPSQTLERRAKLEHIRSPRASLHAFVRSHDYPTIAVVPAEGGGAIARDVAEAIAMALTRAGLAVTQDQRGARYHLANMVREKGVEARLTVWLVDRASGRYLWAHQLDGASADAFRFEEHAAASVAAAIQPGLRAAEIARAEAKPDTDLTAYDLTLRALPHAIAFSADRGNRALDLLDRAMRLDPDHALAVALSAWCHAQRVIYQFTESPAEETSRVLNLARHAVNLGGDATVLAIVGGALTSAHDLKTADLVMKKAVSLDGSSAWAWGRSGWVDVYSGRLQSAIERFAVSLELAPHDPLAFNSLVGIGCAHFHAGRNVEAIPWLERAIAEHPVAAWAHRILSPAYAFVGRKLEAQLSLDAVRRTSPDLTISQVTAAMPLPPALRDHLADGLDSLGLAP